MKPSLFACLPEDFAAGPNDPSHVFGRIMRIASWKNGKPDLGKHGLLFLLERFDASLPEIVSQTASNDGSTKFVLKLHDGLLTECVHMPRDVREPRVTLCVSSQVGCGMGCSFCATGKMGFIRQLSRAEIVSQVMVMVQALGPRELGRISVVFMGMGEPLQNLTEVLAAVRILSDVSGLGIAPSRITVSTSGLAAQIEELGRALVRPQLALSLNAANDAMRLSLMPVNKTANLAVLKDVLLRFPFKPHEKLTLEYVLLDGVNDTLEDADGVALFAKGFRHNVNVIPFNSFDGSGYAEPSDARIDAFVKRLQSQGTFVTVRRSRGRDASAACGQLVQLSQSRQKSKKAPTPDAG
jgi:23S rRNA (adenine2503-C2)-methyltransferase